MSEETKTTESLAIVPTNSNKVMVPRSQINRSELDVLRNAIAPDANEMEIKYFLLVCQRAGFDPLSKQVYLVPRSKKTSSGYVTAFNPMISIDGLRLIAQRSGECRGQVGPQWCGQDGAWKDVWLEDSPPTAARVGVMRQGFSQPLMAQALWKEYRPEKVVGTWLKLPTVMLAKCAEALALRKAFPAEMSGLYVQEEMGQSQAEPLATPELKQDLHNAIMALGEYHLDGYEKALNWFNEKNLTMKDKIAFDQLEKIREVLGAQGVVYDIESKLYIKHEGKNVEGTTEEADEEIF